MKTIAIIQWYTEESEGFVFLIYLLVGFLLAFGILILLKLSGIYVLLVIGAVILVEFVLYYAIKRVIRKKYFSYVLGTSGEFEKEPTFEGKVYVSGIDSADIEILSTIRELGSDYFLFIPSLTRLFSLDEILRRVGKLYALKYVRVHNNGVSITSEGFYALKLPPGMLRANIPPEISVRLIQTRFLLSEGNYSGVIDNVTKLFEYILKKEFQERYVDKLETEWSDLINRRIIDQPFLRANLGHLRAAAMEKGILTQGDIYDHFISAFLKLRAPEKHETVMPTDTLMSAQTALSLAEDFCRHWFR